MLRAEHCICGTSSTGTGTLALAACPQPPGGTDLYQAFQVQGLGTSVAIPVSYTIVEYTGSDFQTASKQEKGIGKLTLGASITATTLARTTVQQTATGMTGAATYDTSAPTAVSIATAANTLVFLSASASDLLACSPYFDTTLPSSDGRGALPVNVGGEYTSNIDLTRLNEHYHLFEWRVPMLVKRLELQVGSTVSGGSKVYGRIYAVGENARPTKLLYDFGSISGSGLNALTSAVPITSGAAGNGFYLQPGEYYLSLAPFMSASGPPILRGFPMPYNTGRLGYSLTIGPPLHLTASSPSSLAGDPANVTGLDIFSPNQIFFALAAS